MSFANRAAGGSLLLNVLPCLPTYSVQVLRLASAEARFVWIGWDGSVAEWDWVQCLDAFQTHMYEDARLQSTTSKKKLYVRKMLHMNPSGTAASSMLGMMKNTNGLILTFPTLKQPVLFLYHRIVPRALKLR
ncbi:hypothetical protein M431DRAFT_372815 [Trichoderma harzianum CBS 226.95]|uniref:Uncharacterized protein n=1 Tax=Trichoderma harzianum CBS 226.95 TaxID=983964 RepID=A0A2T4AHC4_TRIHA|nr:hypothetical protein M431DRAFT_372815 [Trichoderma harzianum CBS 226.95]PTB56318.1 hypothetical protein M431DRAFT_372815 [Trichoderma harzianum CBS 226.95]